jgi:RNA-directed DNA polymerase
MGELQGRVEKFGLELSPEKTRRIEFLREAEPGLARFDFLGFEFSWGRDRQGRPHIQRRTSRVRLRASIARLTEWCRDERRRRLRPLFADLNAKLRGYYQYYGVYGNYRSLKQFYTASIKILFKWLNRRSQRRSFTWAGFSEVLKAYEVPPPCCRRRILQAS